MTAKAAQFGVGLADTAQFFGPFGMSTGRHIMDMVTGEKTLPTGNVGVAQEKWESSLESFKAKLNPTIQKERTRFAQNLATTMRDGGTLPAVALQVSEAVWNTAIDLIAMKYVTGGMPGGVGKKAATKAAQALPSLSRAKRWVTGAKATLRHAGALAAYRAMVTPGDAKTKAESAATTMAYMATPAISGGIPSASLAKFFDFAMNSGITVSTGQYKDAVAQAKMMARDEGKPWSTLNNAGKAKYLAVVATPLAVTDAYFSLLTKSFTSKGATRQAMVDRIAARMEQNRVAATEEAARMESEYGEVAAMARNVAELREEMHADADARTMQPNRTTEPGTSEDVAAQLREQAARVKEDRAPDRDMRANEVEGLRILREMRGETAPTPGEPRAEPIKSLDQLDPGAFPDERAAPPAPDVPPPVAPKPASDVPDDTRSASPAVREISDAERDELGLTRRDQDQYNASQAIGKMAKEVRAEMTAFLESKGMTREDLPKRNTPEGDALNREWREWSGLDPDTGKPKDTPAPAPKNGITPAPKVAAEAGATEKQLSPEASVAGTLKSETGVPDTPLGREGVGESIVTKPARVTLNNNPQPHEVVRKLPRQPNDLPEEQYYEVRNERTGEVETVEASDMKEIRSKAETVTDKIISGAKKAAKAIDSEAKKATKRMDERAEGRFMSGLDERDMADATIRGADMVIKGATDFASWSKKMVSAIGERVRSSLGRIWKAVTSYLTRVPKYKTKLPEAKYDVPKITDQTGAVKDAPATQPVTPAQRAIPAKRGIVSRILGAFSTEQPFRDINAPETGKAQKALASRRSMGSERAIEIVAKELNPITKGLPEEQARNVWKHVFFKVSNPKYNETPAEIRKQVDEAVAVINTVNKEYLGLLKKEGVLNQAWPESHISRESGRWSELATQAADITEGKFRIPGVPKKLGSEETRFNLEDRRLGEIFKEMDGIAGRIEKLKSLRYIHLPSRIWMAEKSSEDPEGFDAVLSGNFSGIKGRRTLDPYDLTQIKDKNGQPLLNPDKVDAREALALYVRYVEGQRAQAEIRRTAIAEGLVKTIKAAPSDWAKPDVEKFPIFAGKKLHPAFYDLLKSYHNATGKNSTLNKLFTYMKMQNFINPIIMPMYDTFQAVALTQGRAILPWNLLRAYKDAMGNTENYREASWYNLFSKPDAAPFKDFQEQLQRQLKGGGLEGWAKTEMDRLIKTGEKLPKKAALLLPRVTRDIYHGMWFTAWKGDQILRMASYNVMRKQGFSPQDSARLAAEAHADYAGVPKASRKTLNKIFFTPTFQISMMKWAARQMMAPAKVATAQLNKAMGKSTSIDTKMEVQRSMTLLTSMAMLGGMHYLITNLLGWETEEWGRKYKKEVVDPDTGEKKEVVVSFANPINVPLKYYHQFIRRRDGTTKPEQIAKYGQFLIHPMYRLLINIAQNKRPNGEPIVDQFDSPAKVAIDWSRYVSGQMVTLYREILDKPETTEAEAFKLLRENDQPKLDQAMRTIAFGYVRGEESNRVKYKTTRMFQQFSSGLRQNPPKSVRQLESRYKRFLATLGRFEKEAKTDELRITLMKSQRKAMKNMAVDVAIFSESEQYTEQEYERAQKIKRRG